MIECEIDIDGTKRWYNGNGNLHKVDGPAIEYVNGTKKWCIEGLLHREDGPALESADGTKWWLINGEQHRENGPAVERPDGTKEYWINDVKLTDLEIFVRFGVINESM